LQRFQLGLAQRAYGVMLKTPSSEVVHREDLFMPSCPCKKLNFRFSFGFPDCFVLEEPWNCTLYADVAEYSLFGAHLQYIVSFSMLCKSVSRTSIQRFTNSQSCWLDTIFRTLQIQFLFVSSFATILFLKWAILKRLRPISLGALP
jgi:hypothetical protein